MAMLMGSRGDEILRWKATERLAASLKGQLARTTEQLTSTEARHLLTRVLETLDAELGSESATEQAVASLEDRIDRARPSELPRLSAERTGLLREYFRRRRSVLALFDLGNRLHDRLLGRALALTEEASRQRGMGEPPRYALFAAGDRGRGEQGLQPGSRYFLVLGDEVQGYRFALEVAASLGAAGLIREERELWAGTFAQFRLLISGANLARRDPVLASPTPAAPPWAPELEELLWRQRLELLPDLACLGGDAGFGARVAEVTRETLQRDLSGVGLVLETKSAVSLPVAVGLFGRWRLERRGEHRGEIDLEELALTPLIRTVRVHALRSGIAATGTVARVRELLEKGALDVELAERLLACVQCLMELKLAAEAASDQAGHYLNPHELSEAWEQRFRDALETLVRHQKIVYQKLIEQG